MAGTSPLPGIKGGGRYFLTVPAGQGKTECAQVGGELGWLSEQVGLYSEGSGGVDEGGFVVEVGQGAGGDAHAFGSVAVDVG